MIRRAKQNLVVSGEGEGQVSFTVESIAGVPEACQFKWEFRNIGHWNPLTTNFMRLYYYEAENTPWKMGSTQPDACFVCLHPKNPEAQ